MVRPCAEDKRRTNNELSTNKNDKALTNKNYVDERSTTVYVQIRKIGRGGKTKPKPKDKERYKTG